MNQLYAVLQYFSRGAQIIRLCPSSVWSVQFLIVGIVTIKKLCDGLEITLIEFFDTPEFKALEQEIQ
jgi:hypothetical protein